MYFFDIVYNYPVKRSEIRSTAGTILWILSVLLLFLTGYRGIVTAVILFVSGVYFLVQAGEKQEGGRLRGILSGACVVFSAGLLAVQCTPLLYAVFLLSFSIGILEEYGYFRRNAYVWKKTYPSLRVQYIGHAVRTVLLAGIAAVLVWIEWHPEAFVKRMVTPGENRTVYEESYEQQENNVTLYGNVVYSDTYPNSICDIRVPEQQTAGTVVWLPGGDHLYGDRNEQDNHWQLIRNSLREGFTTVSADLAFAPDYAFPSPLYQLDALLCYLSENIPGPRIILTGTGAGAETILQYITALCSIEYAEKNSITLNYKGPVTAVYLCGALVQPQYGASTGLILTDLSSYHLLRMYYGKTDLRYNRTAVNADVLPYISRGFPLMLVSDGNSGTYSRQAHRLADIARERGILYDACIYDKAKDDRELLFRSFDTGYTSYASAVHGRYLEMLKEIKEDHRNESTE